MNHSIPHLPVKILLVEDNQGDVRLARETFKEANVPNRMFVVNDGEEALLYLRKQGKYASESTPDIVLLDLNLPRKDGREVLREIKNSEDLKHIPVVVLTTSSSEDDIKKAYEHYVNCYITKPVEFGQFVEVVKSIQDFWLKTVTLPETN